MEIIEKMENIIKHYLNNNRPIIIIGEVSSRRTFLVKKAIKELGEQMNFINYNTELTLDGIIENKINVIDGFFPLEFSEDTYKIFRRDKEKMKSILDEAATNHYKNKSLV